LSSGLDAEAGAIANAKASTGATIALEEVLSGAVAANRETSVVAVTLEAGAVENGSRSRVRYLLATVEAVEACRAAIVIRATGRIGVAACETLTNAATLGYGTSESIVAPTRILAFLP